MRSSLAKKRMNQNITLTLHAEERLHQRSSETLDSLERIISERKYVSIGHEAGSNREHFLFYSREDQIWHVIVIDVKTKQIITILPIDFHENISWKVSADALQEAKDVIEGKENLEVAQPLGLAPSVIRIVGVYSQSWKRSKRLNLGSWPFNHNLQLPEFFPDAEFWTTVEGRIQGKEQSLENIESMFIYRNNGPENQVEIELPRQWTNGQQSGSSNGG